MIEDPRLAHALAVAHERASAEDLASAETSILVALRHLLMHHGACRDTREPVENSGARRRLAIYEDLIETRLAGDLDLQTLASAAGVTRFQVIRDFKKASRLTRRCSFGTGGYAAPEI